VTEPQEETTARTSAHVDVEELGPCKRKLVVSVPKDTIQAEVVKTFDELADSAVVPGFRPGRAPRRLLEARFGDAVREQVKEQLIGRSYQEALEEHSLEPVGMPDVENVEFDPDAELAYEVTLEIKPIFEVEGYEGLQLEKPPTEPTEEALAEALERLRDREAYYETVEGAVFGEGYQAVVDCEVTIDGESYIGREQTTLTAGQANWLHVLSDEVDEPLQGKAAGDEVTFSTVIRPEFPDEDRRGKVAEVKVKFHEIKERRLPEADDEFAQGLGMENLDDLKGRIRTELTRQKQSEAQTSLRQQVSDQLLEKFDFELPAELLQEHAEDSLRRRRLDLQYRGVPLEEITKHAEELEEASQKQTEREFKLLFILEKIAEKEKVFATENDLENEIAALASNYRVRPARMRAEMERRKTLGELRIRIRERKTIDLLVSKAQITEATATQPEEATEPEQDTESPDTQEQSKESAGDTKE